MTGLEAVGVFVPPTSVAVADLREPLGLTPTDVTFFTRYLGLDRIVVAGDVELRDMLVRAGEDALQRTDRAAVRFVIHTHTGQHVTTAAPELLLEEVRQELGLVNATGFGLSHLNCVTGLHALHVARSLLAGCAPHEKVLVLAADRIASDRLRLMPGTTVLGDAAAAVVVGGDAGGDRILGRAVTVIGRFYQGVDAPPELAAEYKAMHVDNLRAVMEAALADAGVAAGDLAVVLPHNVNRLSWKRIGRELGIPLQRFYLDNVPRYGHSYTSDVFLNLHSLRLQGRAGPGDLVLLVATGVGATFAATVLRLGDGAHAGRPTPPPEGESS